MSTTPKAGDNATKFKPGDKVRFGTGEAIYEVAVIKAFPHGFMVGIYDEPPGKHIDYLNPGSLTLVEELEDKDGEGEEYEFITAEIDCGELSWHYKIKGAQVPGTQDHDEDVSDWSDEDIRNLTMTTLQVPEHQRNLINIEYI